MIFQSVLFYLFSGVLLLAALGVVFFRNPVHSIMCLVLAFFQSAILWMLIEAEFLAIVLVLVYVLSFLDRCCWRWANSSETSPACASGRGARASPGLS